ncbi:MAG: TetR/AcrR family transcriptional regulator, partial [Bdellovibrionota bacterium]
KKKYQETHEKLLEVAARSLREDGIERASVAKVMAGAGLTVGAFYAHFSSKKDLIKKSFAWAVNSSKQRIDQIKADHPSDKLSVFLERSLSVEHRDSPGEGCPLAALSLDFTREDKDVRRFFSDILSEVLSHRLSAFSPPEEPLSEDDVIDFLSTLVGTLILARATRGTELSDRILKVMKSKLKFRFIPKKERGLKS